MAYNLSIVPTEILDRALGAFDEVIKAGCGFFNSYRILDHDPRVPQDCIGVITLCSITMDGVFQRNGIPVKMAYGGRLEIEENIPQRFRDLIGTGEPLSIRSNSLSHPA